MVLPELPAKILKQDSAEDVDLSLLLVEEKLLSSVRLPRMQLCEAPPWPGDPVIVVDARHATKSQIVPPQVLPFTLRTKFSTLIRDVATTGDSGSGVFDPNRKCLLGIISGKLTSHTTEGDKVSTSFRQRQFATLCPSSSDHDVMACSPGGLFVASSGEARQLFFGDSKEATARKLAREDLPIKSRFRWASFFGS